MTKYEAYENAKRRASVNGDVYDDGIHTPNYHYMTLEEYLLTQVTPRTPYRLGYSIDIAEWDHLYFVADAFLDGVNVPPDVFLSTRYPQELGRYIIQRLFEMAHEND